MADRISCRAAPKRHKKSVMAQLVLDLTDEAAPARLAARIAGLVRARDTIALRGPLGSGKTSFARAFIRTLGTGTEEVPSPTFTLVETYQFAGRPPIWHFDLYRLVAAEDVYELGIEEAWSEGVALIEWPERIATLLPRERLDIVFEQGAMSSARRATVDGSGPWLGRLHE
jgi:tRNA threonylcarbamoyladenosine biosynthesis protein TsaE